MTNFEAISTICGLHHRLISLHLYPQNKCLFYKTLIRPIITYKSEFLASLNEGWKYAPNI